MNNATQNFNFHTFRYTKADIRTYFPEPTFQEIIATDAFKRLKSIHFLGSIDFLLNGSRKGVEERNTRFDHSLGVAALAKRFALAHHLEENAFNNVVIAALLHDVGHAPLSHSMEPAFKQIFEISHHVAGEKILRGEVRVGTKLAKAFDRRHINNIEVMALIAGCGLGIAREPFARSINVDTIEGIIRTASYLYRREVLLNPIVVLDAFTNLGRAAHDVLDEFWKMKSHVYSKIIQSPKGLMADFLCKRYLEIYADKFTDDVYLSTESDLRRRHAPLFNALERLGKDDIVEPDLVRDREELAYTRRTFLIDNSVILRNYSDVDRRYLQKKVKKTLVIKKGGGEDAHRLREHPAGAQLF